MLVYTKRISHEDYSCTRSPLVSCLLLVIFLALRPTHRGVAQFNASRRRRPTSTDAYLRTHTSEDTMHAKMRERKRGRDKRLECIERVTEITRKRLELFLQSPAYHIFCYFREWGSNGVQFHFGHCLLGSGFFARY